MSKKKINVKMVNYGQYEKWDRTTRKLPELIHISDTVEADIDVEFGYIIEISGAKGKTLNFRIDHPPFKDKFGNIEPSFTGEYFIDSNRFSFYLGDCIWAPVEDKLGKWTMTTIIENDIIAQKTIQLTNSIIEDYDNFDW